MSEGGKVGRRHAVAVFDEIRKKEKEWNPPVGDEKDLFSREFFPIEKDYYRKERSVLDKVTARGVSILNLN